MRFHFFKWLPTHCIFSPQESMPLTMRDTDDNVAAEGVAAASTKGYVHLPSCYDHDVDKFEEVKHHAYEQALQRCHDRNGHLAKEIIEMIDNPPPLVESGDYDSTIPYVGKSRDKVHNGKDNVNVDGGTNGDKVNYSPKVEVCVSIQHK